MAHSQECRTFNPPRPPPRFLAGICKLEPKIIRFCPDALEVLNEFSEYVELELGPEGEFANMQDWAGKLVGAVCRIAGIFQGIIYLADPKNNKCEIDSGTIAGAIEIGRYLILHAKAAYFEMGADPAIETARRLLQWVSLKQKPFLSKRDAFNALRGRVRLAKEMDAPLQLLVDHEYIRPIEVVKTGPGRPASPKYQVNPTWLAQNDQNTHN